MFKRIIFTLILIFAINTSSSFAAYYVSGNKITYIGETEKFHCYIYDLDVNMVVRLTDFHKSGNWAASIALEPKLERTRQGMITSMKKDVDSGSFDTMVLPVQDNKLWAMVFRFSYNKQENRMFMKDTYWINGYGEIIAMTRFSAEEIKDGEYKEYWSIKDLADKHIHKRYQEEYERRNTVVR